MLYKRKSKEPTREELVNNIVAALSDLANMMTVAKINNIDVGFSIPWNDAEKKYIPKPRIVEVLKDETSK